MAKGKTVTPSHRTVLQRGIHTAGDYMKLVQTLIWDVSNKLVPFEQAQRLIQFMMPRDFTFSTRQIADLRRKVAKLLGAGPKDRRGRTKARREPRGK